MDYQELIRLSTKGDEQALEDLFALAEKLSSEQKHEEASKVFRESAISYRISVFRNSGLAEAASGKAYRLGEEIKLIMHWIQSNPSGLRPLPRLVEGLNKECIFKIVGDEIWPKSNPDEEFGSLMLLLETVLDKIDGGNLPANSPLRRILNLMNDYFGLNPYHLAAPVPHEVQIIRNKLAAQSLEHIKSLPLEVRIWVDLLADEVEKRFHASKA